MIRFKSTIKFHERPSLIYSEVYPWYIRLIRICIRVICIMLTTDVLKWRYDVNSVLNLVCGNLALSLVLDQWREKTNFRLKNNPPWASALLLCRVTAILFTPFMMKNILLCMMNQSIGEILSPLSAHSTIQHHHECREDMMYKGAKRRRFYVENECIMWGLVITISGAPHKVDLVS